MNDFNNLLDIVSQLRKECAWDKEQTHESLAKHLIEESYELLDTLSNLNDSPESFNDFKEELGDLLLQILLHSEIASENNYFSIIEVINSLQKKLIKRHPHVFDKKNLNSSEEVEDLAIMSVAFFNSSFPNSDNHTGGLSSISFWFLLCNEQSLSPR